MYSRSGFGDLEPSFTFEKTSGPGDVNSFRVGESWVIRVTGPSSQPVYVQGGKNGEMVTTQMGSTDASGKWTISGTMTADQIGHWTERWWIGDGPPASLAQFSFEVLAAPSTDQSTNPTHGSYMNPAYIPPSVINQITDSSGLEVAGYHVPWWALAGAAGLAILAFTGRR